jgi:hypothetical protein
LRSPTKLTCPIGVAKWYVRVSVMTIAIVSAGVGLGWRSQRPRSYMSSPQRDVLSISNYIYWYCSLFLILLKIKGGPRTTAINGQCVLQNTRIAESGQPSRVDGSKTVATRTYTTRHVQHYGTLCTLFIVPIWMGVICR